MHSSELKSILIDKINKIDDNHLLVEATRLINIELPIEEEQFVFSDMQKAKIKNALNQIDKGEYLTAEEANNVIDHWLNK